MKDTIIERKIESISYDFAVDFLILSLEHRKSHFDVKMYTLATMYRYIISKKAKEARGRLFYTLGTNILVYI